MLDENRAPGQSYNAFICQLDAIWMYNDKEIATKRGYLSKVHLVVPNNNRLIEECSNVAQRRCIYRVISIKQFLEFIEILDIRE